MRKTLAKIAALAMAALLGAVGANAQIVTTQPSILQQESQNIVLTYHADSPLGNNGLKGYTGDVYAHAGVITTASTSSGDWKHAPSWGDNSPKYKLNRVAEDTYELDVGDMNEYFGLGADEVVTKIALVFRAADNSREGKTASGGDIFVDVQESGFRMALSCDAANTVLTGPTTVTFSVFSTRQAELALAVNGEVVASASNAMELVKACDFSKQGTYSVVATATAEGQTLESTISIAYPMASEAADYPGGTPKMGVTDNGDGTVTFCLAAPGKQSAVLVPAWDDYQVLERNSMKYHDYEGNRYFWLTVDGLDSDKYYPYYFLVDGKKTCDPYAELVLDCYSDKWLDASIWPDMPKYPYDRFDDTMLAVYCGRLNEFEFSEFEIPSSKNLIIYELLLRDFTGTEGESRGDGTVRQAIEKIPYLKEMGVNAVELMPIMEFNGNNSWGYNTNFYFAPDKAYGSPLDYKEFIEECHRNGIAVILDIVFNQSDGLHPWYQMYPIDENPFYNKQAPHDYSVLNDWRQDNPLVQQQWKDCVKYWLTEYNADGFRFDLVKGLGDNSSYGGGTEAYNKSRVANMRALQEAMLAVKPNAIHINENLAGAREENEMAAFGQLNWSNVNHASCLYAMGTSDGAADIAGFLAENWGRTPFSTVAYIESHDEERVAFRQKQSTQAPIKNNHDLRMRRLGSLAVQMLMTPGAKMIWQFGELGADQTTKNGGGNDTGTKEVIWRYLDDADRAALQHTYAMMCNLRTLNPELFSEGATFEVSDISSLGARTYRIANGDQEAVAFINARIGGSAPAEVQTMASKLTAANSKLVCASLGYEGSLDSNAGMVTATLKPNEYAVYCTTSTAGSNSILGDMADKAQAISGVGEIMIVGDYQSVSVYGASGLSHGCSLKVPAGLYIVVIDGQASKVMVR